MEVSKHLLCIFLVFFTQTVCFSTEYAAQSITREELRDHVYFLASDFLNGRSPGTPGFDIACRYAASQFQAAGLKPVLKNSKGLPTFLQPVPLIRRVLKKFFFEINRNGAIERIPIGNLFKISLFDYSSAPVCNVPVVFVGFGIREDSAGWNDLKGLDIQGKVVLLLRGTPQQDGRPVLPDELEKVYNSPSGIMAKLEVISSFKPLAVIIPPSENFLKNWEKRAEGGFWPQLLLVDQEKPYYPWIDIFLPKFGLVKTNLLVAKREFLRMLMLSQRYSPFENDSGIDMQGYHSFVLEGIRIGFDFEFDEKSVSSWNVIAMVPGSDPVSNSRFVCTGAHLDHFPPRNGKVMNGADDNASGSSAVMEIAEAVRLEPTAKSQLFVLFTCEETGLLGSRYFARHCPVPVLSIDAFINLDMIGRTHTELKGSGGHFVSSDIDRYPELWKLVCRVNSGSQNIDFRLREGIEYVLRSDQCYFYAQGIPSIGFDSGAHEDYHRDTDEADKLEYDKMHKISLLMLAILQELGKDSQRLVRR